MKNLAKKTTLSVATLSMVLSNVPAVSAEVINEAELNEEVLSETAVAFEEKVQEIVNEKVGEQQAQQTLENIMTSTKEVIGTIDGVNSTVGDIETALQEVLGGSVEEYINDKIDEEISNLEIEDIIQAGKDVADKIGDLSNANDNIMNDAEGAIKDLENAVQETVGGLNGAIQDAYDSITEDVKEIIGESNGAIMDGIEDLEDVLEDATNDMIDDSTEAETAAKDAIQDIEDAKDDVGSVAGDAGNIINSADQIQQEVAADKATNEEAVKETEEAIKNVIESLENVDSTEENQAKVEAEEAAKKAEEAAQKAADLEKAAQELINQSGANKELTYDADLVEQLKKLQSQANEEAAKAQQAVQSANALVLNSQSEVDSIANKAAAAQEKVESLLADLKNKVTVTGQDDDLAKLNAEIAAAKQELATYKNDLAKAEADLEAAKVLALAAQSTANTANKVLNETQDKLEEANEIVNTLTDAAIAKAEAEFNKATSDYNNAVSEAAKAQKAYEEALAAWKEAGEDAITEAELLALSAAAKVSADVAVRYYELMIEKQDQLITENENAIQNNKEQIAEKEEGYEEEKAEIEKEMQQVLADKEAANKEIERLEKETQDDEAFNKGKQDQIDANNKKIDELIKQNGVLESEIADLENAIEKKLAEDIVNDNKNSVTADKEAFNSFVGGNAIKDLVVNENGSISVDGYVFDTNTIVEYDISLDEKGINNFLNSFTNEDLKNIEITVKKYTLKNTSGEFVTITADEYVRANSNIFDGVTYGLFTSYKTYANESYIQNQLLLYANKLGSFTTAYTGKPGESNTTVKIVTTKEVDGETVTKSNEELIAEIIEYKNSLKDCSDKYDEALSYWENYFTNYDANNSENITKLNNKTQTLSNNQNTINGLNAANTTLESEKVVVRDNSEEIEKLNDTIKELNKKYYGVITENFGPIGTGSLKDDYNNVGSNDEEYKNLKDEQIELGLDWAKLQAELVALNGLYAGAEELSEEADAAFQAKLADAKAAAEVLLNATGTLTEEAAQAALAQLQVAITEAKAVIAEDVKTAVTEIKDNYDAQYDYVNDVVTDAATKAEQAANIANAALHLINQSQNASLDRTEMLNVVDLALGTAEAEYQAALDSYQALLSTTYEVDANVLAQLTAQVEALETIKKDLEAAKQAANNAALSASESANLSAENISDMLCNDKGVGLACELSVSLKGSETSNKHEFNTTSWSSETLTGDNLNSVIAHIQDQYANSDIYSSLEAPAEGMMWSIQWNVAYIEENGKWAVEYEYVQVNDPSYNPNVDLDGELPTPSVTPTIPSISGGGSSRPSTGGGSGSGSSSSSKEDSSEEIEDEEILDIEEEETAQGGAITNPVVAAVSNPELRTFLNTLSTKEEIKPYSNFGLKIFDNSRVTSIKATSTGFSISGYMWIDNVKPGANTWREIVLVNTEDMSMENAYRKQATSTKTEWLNKNMTATQNGKLDLSEAGYSIDINYNDLNSYVGNKSGATIKAGTYAMFIRISDGKDSFLFPLVDKVLSDGSTMESTGTLPEGFSVNADEVRSLTVTIK